MEIKKIRKYYWLFGIIIFIILGIVYVKQSTNGNLTTSDEIKILQEKIDSILIQYPWLTSCNMWCRFKDFGGEIRLVCTTERRLDAASGAVYEIYNETGVKHCDRIYESYKLPSKYTYDCKFIEYPKIDPIKKSESITIYSNFEDSNTCGRRERSINYTITDIETKRELKELSEQKEREMESKADESGYFMMKASNTKNPEYCEKIDVVIFRDWCYSLVSEYVNDPNICKKIVEDIGERNSCFIDVAAELQNKSICEDNLEGYDKDDCFKFMAIKNNNHEFCEEIVDEDNKDKCYRGVALRESDPLICKKIKNIERRNSCYIIVAAELQNKSICEEVINLEGYEKDDCLKYAE